MESQNCLITMDSSEKKKHRWQVNIFLNYLFIFVCVGSSFLCQGFLQLQRAGATLHRGAWASHCRGLSCCGAQAPDAQAQQPWLTGLVAPRHVGSSQTRTRTRVPCIGRQTLNRCATREAPSKYFKNQNLTVHHWKWRKIFCKTFLTVKVFYFLIYLEVSVLWNGFSQILLM